jgi:hypothetical protein
MLAEMSSREFAEWQAFASIDGPIGEERADIRMGIQAAATVNVYAEKGQGAKPIDFIPQWDPAEKRNDPMKFLERLKAEHQS